MKHVIVVGGGAAGMMAAIAASEAGSKVTLVEKNEKLGKKLFITGKGRCNVTNAADMETLFGNVVTNEKFLYSAFYDFDNNAVMQFMENAGCPLKIERGDRVFPVSDHSSDVISALTRELKRRNVEILLHAKVTKLITVSLGNDDVSTAPNEMPRELTKKNAKKKEGSKKQCGSKVVSVTLADGRNLEADAVILCTGGVSYASTGSDGDGHEFAESLGHRMVKNYPSLVPLETAETWCKNVMGLSLKNVSLQLVCDGKQVYQGFGEMLFTHFGVSGPLVLSASSYYCHGSKANLFLDLKPAMEEEVLDKRLLREFEENKNKHFKNALGSLFPVKLIPVMIALSGIDPEKKVNEISREERIGFVKRIKSVPLTVTGTRNFAEAIITRGGVSVKDINPSTMESKLVKNLYFAGELVDVDALTGGFNLQIAWSTGHLAGESAGMEE